MHYRRLGRTELLLSEVSLGTVELGLNYGITPDGTGLSPPSTAEAIRLLHQAIEAGLNFIDTARAYGTSEEIIGQALPPGRRHQLYLATKVACLGPGGQPLSGETLRHQMRQFVTTSLRRLRTDGVDLLLLHDASVPALQSGEAVAVLKELQAEGLTRYIGASTYGIEAPRLAIAQGVEALQVAYNVLDQTLADDIFPLAQAQGVGLIIRSIFLKGALTDRGEDLPPHMEPLKQRSRAFRQFVAGLTPPLPAVQVSLRFALGRPEIATILVGVRTEPELEEALQAAAAGPLPAEVMAHLQTMRWSDPLLNPSRWGIP
jgi:1-deoxyxylulose-5-phosphate synthase